MNTHLKTAVLLYCHALHGFNFVICSLCQSRVQIRLPTATLNIYWKATLLYLVWAFFSIDSFFSCTTGTPVKRQQRGRLQQLSMKTGQFEALYHLHCLCPLPDLGQSRIGSVLKLNNTFVKLKGCNGKHFGDSLSLRDWEYWHPHLPQDVTLIYAVNCSIAGLILKQG